jgi:hypothetical protein
MSEERIADSETASRLYSGPRFRVLARSIARIGLALTAVTAGAVTTRAAASSMGVIALMAVVLAAANGYSKAYSP